MTRWSTVAALGAILGLACADWPSPAEAAPRHAPAAVSMRSRGHHHGLHAHRSTKRHGAQAAGHHPSRVQTGKASVYASSLRGRRMADGTRFDPASNAAASKTLPLGTTARVTNLKNGRTATVMVRDRGPHVRGRILDVSPSSGQALGMRRDGVAPVAVVPTADPLTRGQ
jgi:rare lipoprotein A